MDKATRKDECVERVTRVASHRQLDIGFSWFSGGLMGGTRNLSQQQDMTFAWKWEMDEITRGRHYRQHITICTLHIVKSWTVIFEPWIGALAWIGVLCGGGWYFCNLYIQYPGKWQVNVIFVVKTLIVCGARQINLPRDKVTYWAILDS